MDDSTPVDLLTLDQVEDVSFIPNTDTTTVIYW